VDVSLSVDVNLFEEPFNIKKINGEIPTLPLFLVRQNNAPELI
jgi:hypothetical protein